MPSAGMAPIIKSDPFPSIDSNMNSKDMRNDKLNGDHHDDPTYATAYDDDMLPHDDLKGDEGDEGDDDFYNGEVSSSKKMGTSAKLYRNNQGGPINGTIGVSSLSSNNNALLIQPNNVCKVIKGEIHNVLNAMRADARYVSPLRFVEELPTDEQHPLLLQMRDLHTELGEWELLHYQQRPEPKMYLKPFCAAIQGRDISASVTGAALHAIHKFLLYGFLAHEHPESYATIANTLLLCTFEETSAEEGVSARTRITNAMTNNNRADEQVVLKLLDLSALVVRCASHSLDAELIVGLLDTCLHVSHRAKRASPLLKSAATDALGQIVLEVFSNDLMHAREAVLSKLAMLLNPQQNSDAYAVNSLTLVNIALETLQDDLSEREINILSNDLCKYLLQWSTTHDLVILSLTLRVIFNLFQTIRNHLKVPLEVFLTSVHLRILEHSTSAEEREVALESLLEFCQEPALMKDLYLNYDCDVNCTNLYESICTTLGTVAVTSPSDPKITLELAGAATKDKKAPKLSEHKVAPNKTLEKAALAQAEIPLNALNMFAVDGLTTIIDSIARRCKGDKNGSSRPTELNRSHSYSSADSLEDDIGAQVTEEELQERKRKKYALSNISKAFNKDPKGKEWLEIGRESGIIDDTPASVAQVLYSAPGLDKVYIGEYLAKGPKEDYPFEHDVRLAFAKEYDFSNETSFAGALRLFLSKFRMPGEAQCIDRFMEAFSNELYRQQGEKTIFKNADAAFVLAFSTIMLNTDLHNPMIKNVSRMTIEQFVKNNRGINDGEDLPEGMLRQLYEEIKQNEIQLQREIGEFITKAETKAQDFRSVWGDLLAKNVAAPVFSSAEEARLTMFEAGVHEKDMFLTVAKPAMKALQSAFLRSWDDGTVVNILAGFENMARISTFFSLDKILNDIVSFLLLHGRDYINGVVALEYAGIESGAPIGGGMADDDETMSIVDTDSPLPMSLIRAKEIASIDSKKVDISGVAAYRGVISLNMGLKIVRALFPRIREAWPALIEVFCALRDARALPEGLGDLDDFADSDGNVLPLSKFAKFSQFQLDSMYRGKGSSEKNDTASGDGKGWFRMFGGRGETSDVPTTINIGGGQGRGEDLSSNAKVLLEIAERTEVEKFMVLGVNVRMPIVKQSVVRLLESVDQFPATPGNAYEQHTAFTLELAARALLMSQERARELLPLFLSKFNSVMKKSRRVDTVILPFIVERMVVTILRTCIHLYSIPPAREQLKPALISFAALPKAKFICHVADRIACGLAIIVQSSFAYFRTPEDWKFIGNMFDTLAYYPTARGLVFDGIASTIEAAIPDPVTEETHPEALRKFEAQLNSKPALSLPAATEFQKNLFKFMYAAYQKDFSLQAPSILCLEKVLGHYARMQMVLQLDDHSRAAPPDSVPDKEMWQRFAVGLFNAMGSYDPETSQTAYDCFQRIILTTEVEQIADDKWLALLKVVSNKQAPIEYDETRVHTFATYGEVLLYVTPVLTQEKENWKPLTEFTKQFAIMADENLRKGRGSKALFEKTISTVTTMSNVLGSREFQGDRRYSKWASDSLFTVLEKNGAGGGSSKNVALTQKQEQESSSSS